MPRVSTTPRVKIIWIKEEDILMPCVNVYQSSHVALRRGMVTWQDDKITTWVREPEYEAFQKQLRRYT